MTLNFADRYVSCNFPKSGTKKLKICILYSIRFKNFFDLGFMGNLVIFPNSWSFLCNYELYDLGYWCFKI